MGLLDLFDRVVILNLPAREDRRREMRESLGRIGRDPDDPRVTWFPAIDPGSAAGFPTPGVRGCFLSHLAALNLARNAGARRVLVLEDDCDFVDDFAGRQEEVAGRLGAGGWGIAYLGHDRPEGGPPGLRACPPGEALTLAHSYAVDAGVLPRLCAYLEAIPLRAPGSAEGGPMHYDGALNWFRRDHPGVSTVLVAPALTRQRPSRSDLSPRWFDRVPVVSSAAGRLRAIRRSLARVS